MTHTLVLLRHGQSEWNERNLFTGWVDVDLTDLGRSEAARGGAQLRAAGLAPSILHTSLQLRAIRTAEIALDELGRKWIPVRRSWRLNERHYGVLQGKNKKETVARFGEEQVRLWRRSYDIPPEPMPIDDPMSGIDERYADLPRDILPRAECLADVVARMLPHWYDAIVSDLRAAHTVLVAAHGNSLRALVRHLDAMSNQAVVDLNIPTGFPLVYELDDDMQPITTSVELGVRGRYLDPAGAAEAIEGVKAQTG
jgi:2,3-bisphosphoglycerate-dependent phosphoglycerate mutase